jgi:flagellin
MPQFVNTNVASINTQRSLNQSQGALQTSLQRLSSGLRINSAKDDAAGLAISERMTGQIRGMNQAMRNANDGISLSQTAESAMSETTNILQRIRELAVQSANATNNDTDRAALNAEVTQLTSELDRIASTTAFNGTKLIDGSFTAQQFQVGANVGETITVASIASSRASDMGRTTDANLTGSVSIANGTTAVPATALAAGDLTVNGNDVGAVAADASLIATAISATSSSITATASNTSIATFNDSVGTITSEVKGTATPQAVGTNLDYSGGAATFDVDGNAVSTGTVNGSEADLVNALQGSINTSAGAGVYTVGSTGTGASFEITFEHAGAVAPGDGAAIVIGNLNGVAGTNGFTASSGVAGTEASTAVPDYVLSVDGDAIDLSVGAADGTITGAEVATAISALEGYTASYSGTNLTINKVDGSNIVLEESGADSGTNIGLDADGTGGAVSETLIGSVSIVSAGEDLVIAGNAPASAGFSSGTTAAAITGTTMADTTVATVDGANAAIASVDAALTTINGSRADLGALQSRFESTTANLAANVENLSAARSRIRDTDFAVETAELTRVQILQQAGIAMLSQANSAPQNVLALLQ